METNMKKSLLSAFILMATSSFMLSCSSSSATEEEDLGESKKIVNMLSEPQPIKLTAEQKVFANDNNQFTLNFLKTVNEVDQSGKSFIYSPLSITYVLSMVNDAATGKTEEELEQTLGFHKGGIKVVNDYCKKLIEGLPKVDNKVTLDIANAIFLNKDYALKQQFQQDMQNYYDAKAEALDFSSPQTLEHISYLLNAIYFKADWASKFDPKNTKEETFTTEKGSTTLPMMHQNVLISYLKTNTYSAVILPYGSGLWNMTVMLPEESAAIDDLIKEVAQSSVVNNRGWCETGGNFFRGYEVDLKLPRFETASDTDELDVKNGLVGLMKKMGIKLAFDSDFAEIPNMCEDRNLYISMMRQKAKIKVNEEGAEAAAVTVAGMDLATAVGPQEYPKATFHANRPFVYVISEASSGVILFVGKFTGI